MRKIPLDKFTYTLPGAAEPTVVPYTEIIEAVLFQSAPQRPMATPDVVTGLRVLGVVKVAKDVETVLLEEADYGVLAQRLDTFNWGQFAAFNPVECGRFIDSLRDAEKVDPNAKEATQ